MMEVQVPMSSDEQADPEKKISPWRNPYGLSEMVSPCQSFLQFIHQWLYGDTSIETHLKPSGLMLGAGLLLLDIANERIKQRVSERTIHQYKFRHICRTILTLLGIISEIENYVKLDNKEQTRKVWERLTEYNEDAKDVYERRYKVMLA